MENSEIRLAIIYELTESKNFSFNSAALVNYNIFNNTFKVLTGDLSGVVETAFYRFSGSQEYSSNYSDILIDESIDDSKLFGIFIYEPDYLKRLLSYNDSLMEDRETFYTIVRDSRNVAIIPKVSKDKEYYTLPHDLDEITNEEIDEMLIPTNIYLNSDERALLNSYLADVIYHSEKELERKIQLYSSIYETDNTNEYDIVSIINEISKKIVLQESATKTLVTNISFIQKLIDEISDDEELVNELDSRKPAILLDGPTGTGKTAIAKEIASKFNLPIVIVNANSFSETGYVGPTITDILDKLINEAKGELDLASRGIVVIDEVDKIAETDYHSRSMKLGVQKELLGFISGSSYELKKIVDPFTQQKIDFDTSKLTFILSGAFTDIKEKKIKENEKNNLGFNSNSDKKDKTYTITSQDYIDYGLMREFFGRIKVITTTNAYSIDDLKYILLNSSISPLKGFEKTCNMYGYPGITYTDDFIDAVAQKAYEMGTGARALQNLLSGIQDILLLDLMCHDIDINSPVELTTDLLDKYYKRNVRTY